MLAEILGKKAENVVAKVVNETLPVVANTAVTVQPKHKTLTSSQAIIEGARKGVLTGIERLMVTTNCSKEAAIQTLLVMAQLPEHVKVKAILLNACDSRGGGADKLPSVRTIKRWFSQNVRNDLAPKAKQADMTIPDWARLFLSIWQTPQKPTVTWAYKEFCRRYEGNAPSVHAVRRFISKLGNVTREHGRMGARELKNIKVFVRRTFETLMPSDIYTADGHTFDAEVQHPIHGQPWRPEITTVADVATRKIVGWSVDLAESALAVLAALSNAVTTNGIPAIFYVDNGSGYKNALMNDVAVGLMGRLGTEMEHSLPYNSQARGIIERLHQTVWVAAAKELPTYMGADMDVEAKKLAFKITRNDLKNTVKKSILIGFDNFITFCTQKVEAYNNTPHSTLPRIIDASGRRRYMTPNEMWALKIEQGAEIHTPSADDAIYLFKPQAQRKVLRGEISFLNNRYFRFCRQ